LDETPHAFGQFLDIHVNPPSPRRPPDPARLRRPNNRPLSAVLALIWEKLLPVVRAPEQESAALSRLLI